MARVEDSLLAEAQSPGLHPKTTGADKGYVNRNCVVAIREQGVAPHVTRHISVRLPKPIYGRTTRHAGYTRSQQLRSRIEETFGWMKTVGGFRRIRGESAAHSTGRILRGIRVHPGADEHAGGGVGHPATTLSPR